MKVSKQQPGKEPNDTAEPVDGESVDSTLAILEEGLAELEEPEKSEDAETEVEDEAGTDETVAANDSTTSTTPFTKVNVEALPPELQRLHKQMQSDYDSRVQKLGMVENDRQLLGQYGDFIRAVQTDGKLQKVLEAYFRGEEPPASISPATRARGPSEEDPYSYFAEDDKISAKKLVEIAKTELLRELQPKFQEQDQFKAKFSNHFSRLEFQREQEELSKSFPDWQEYVSNEDLLEARRQAPGLPLDALYKILSYDTALSKSGNQARSKEIAKLVGRKSPPASTTNPKREAIRVPKNYDEAFEMAMRGERVVSRRG